MEIIRNPLRVLSIITAVCGLGIAHAYAYANEIESIPLPVATNTTVVTKDEPYVCPCAIERTTEAVVEKTVLSNPTPTQPVFSRGDHMSNPTPTPKITTAQP